MPPVYCSGTFEGFLGRPYDPVHVGIYSVEFGAYGVDTLGKFFCITPGKNSRRKSARNILFSSMKFL